MTASGRRVLLEIYSTTANLPRCTWAMVCLKAAMRWDEEAYGREYDLDRFMIYAADDFNMGAMENKGLNIFNSRFLLADRDTATDADFQTVDAIVAHEYFHNWVAIASPAVTGSSSRSRKASRSFANNSTWQPAPPRR